ncbi:molybdopterin molybdotransferase MoeA [Novosphingobium clariflavum]|uniref:Molybdopterin molybdenumtransferase n=1 Tax=Novosphingobium clariflavum TaxID=2029884 RepID=A0ABV6S421_9SPHN|nr:molybdopterin molybdotransferase MoeA [Novosphingobium clariflavum]
MTGGRMLTLEQAQERLLKLVTPLSIERVDMEGALGRYLAEPLFARRTQPAADVSAMDGYAVASSDLAGPWHVIGESAAGHPYAETVVPGQAVRISTGALLPAGADAVIVQEDLARVDHHVTLTGDAPSPAGKHIRCRGMDFPEGREILPAGIRIGPAQAALAIAAGHKHLPVCRMPRIAVIDSGDELAPDPETCEAHQVPASNGVMLAALARTLPVEITRIGPVADHLDALLAAFETAKDVDLVITSGGASVGDHDLIRPALEAWGARIDFWRVAIKPGKPLLVAVKTAGARQQIVLGLPGNPVSSLVTAYHFLLPVLRAMLGARSPLPLSFDACLAAPLPASSDRREFLRGLWDGATVTSHVLQDSGALAALAASNVLIDRPAGMPAAKAGDPVRVYLLQNGGIA